MTPTQTRAGQLSAAANQPEPDGDAAAEIAPVVNRPVVNRPVVNQW